MATKDIADVLIIGSGASGAPFAWHLSKVPGIKIVCLEQGDWTGRQQAIETEAQAQRKRLRQIPQMREGVRFNPGGYPYDFSESYWQPVLGNAVGGATLHYGAVWQRLHPADFMARSLDGVAQDWPIRYADLAPYYDTIDNFVGISGVAGNPSYPPRSVSLQPAPKMGKLATKLSTGFDKRAWHWWPVERAILTQPHNGRKPCPTNCTTCDNGCPHDAKNSADVVFWPDAIANGVTLKARARVREITVNSQGLADGVLYYDADGRLNEHKARVVVMACNGIGTTRLLLNSKSKRFPNGLANTSGLVGKGLMGHPSARMVGIFPEEPNSLPDDPNSIGLVSDQFYEGNLKHGFSRGMWIVAGGFGAPIAAALGEAVDPTVSTVPPTLRFEGSGSAAVWGSAHHDQVQQRLTRSIAVSVFADELPNETNRIELHPTLTDEDGIPGVKIFYQRSENAKKILTFGMERMTELMQGVGATKVNADLGSSSPGHYLGTARMGSDPKRSVVDGNNRAHDVKNLFIIDGSVFTTAGSVAPTASIQAIALRAADYVKNNSRSLLT
jgi:choline dehydrogenase-like flavoprotein